MILTRYLYPKHNVEYSLANALFKKDSEQAKFWAYELYYSGFIDETINLLRYFCDNYYKNKNYKIFNNEKNENNVGIIIENIILMVPNIKKIEEDFGIIIDPFIKKKKINNYL